MTKFIISILVVFSCFANDALYLNTPKKLPSNNTVTSFGTKLIDYINQSKDSIQFAIYGLRGQDEILQALIKAKQRGVKVQGVVDSDSRGENYYTHTHLLYKHFDIVSDHKSNIMHNKFFIFDQQKVWTGSSNISDTGTGGYNSNGVVVINNQAIASIYLQEFNQMFYYKKFGIWKKELSYENISTQDSYISVYFSPKSNTYEKAIKNLVQSAQNYIYIPIFYLTHKPLAYELIQAHKRGVEIKVILDASAARNKYSIHEKLRQQGILVKVENFGGKMHNKSMIVDDKYIVSGSMNFTKAGNKKNDENTLVIHNPTLAKQYKTYFLSLWNQIPKKYLKFNPSPESIYSINSCNDGIDNDFDKKIDLKDKGCKKF